MFLKLLKFDIRFQFRHGFYYVYAIVCVLYIIILLNIPETARFNIAAYFILSDTSVLGFTFVGALILLEKQQNILQSLFVTPLGLARYLWSKVMSLTLIAFLMSFAIFLSVLVDFDAWYRLVSGVVLSSVFFTLTGLAVVASKSSINGYLAGIMFGGSILSAPLVLYFMDFQWSVIFPINASLDLFIGDFRQLAVAKFLFDCTILIVWIIAAYWYARKQFLKYIINQN